MITSGNDCGILEWCFREFAFVCVAQNTTVPRATWLQNMPLIVWFCSKYKNPFDAISIQPRYHTRASHTDLGCSKYTRHCHCALPNDLRWTQQRYIIEAARIHQILADSRHSTARSLNGTSAFDTHLDQYYRGTGRKHLYTGTAYREGVDGSLSPSNDFSLKSSR